LENILKLVYLWTQDIEQGAVMHECEIGSDHTVGDYYMFCRQVCYEKLERESTLIGGEGVIVEVDEAKFGKRKFNRGKRVDGVWIFGLVERGSNSTRCCVIPVVNRDEETLLSKIKLFVKPGTTIYSDCWKSYSGLAALGYTHMTVNHSKGFKNKETGVDTNTIEGLWNTLRRSLPKYGTTKDMYASYMIEFMYRRRYFTMIPRGERMQLFMKHIASLNNMW
jgi:transposase-like protein